MKYNHKCECSGCSKKGTVKLKNNHYVCDEHYKILKHNKKVKKYSAFFKSIPIGTIGSYPIYCDILIKY